MNGPNPPSADTKRASLLRRVLTMIAIGAAVAAVPGYFVGRALKRSGTPLPDLAIADIASALIGIVLLISAAYAWFATTSGARWNRMVEKQPIDEPVDPETLQSGRWQAVVAALAGVMIIIPPLAAKAALAPLPLAFIAVGLFALLAAQSWINWALWRDGDELTRTVIAQTGALCFWVLQLCLFVWAVLTKLGLAADIDSWSLMTVLMGVYLIASVAISTRRGLVAV